ncbi:MAG: GGDEF domain-containing phosphodiesterase [Clostridium sp.]|nr:GGDEF domain-containing phosphodiesterase [Acetatifactor muris]MCM1527552.1 GGDEF domain-containing phosphodiesterase [Bacteroides sp.]MCM1563794.1 GGDEF domain-containing phosphodiesterase [Clostridium sp.]
MSFDYKEYSEAIDEFLIRMERVSDSAHPDMAQTLKRLCDFLRIARVDEVLYVNDDSEEPRMKEEADGESVTLYIQDGFDEDRTMVYSETDENDDMVLYQIYPFAGGEEWSEPERERIAVLAKSLFVYNGRKRVMKLAKHLIFHDPYLDIYNLPYFEKYCAQKIREGCIGDYGAGYFNLKRFSMINQQVGRTSATEIMAQFIEELKERLGEDEVICRVGGDNFVVLFRKENLNTVIDHLKGRGIVCDPEEDDRVFVSAVAGYYMIPETTTLPSDITDNAGIAFNLAKNVNNEPYMIYSDELAETIKENKFIEDLFTEALQNGEFEVYYQPKVALKDYSLAGAEALCRWIHDGTMMMPGKFIPVFEQSKAVTLLDFYILEHVCRDLRRWMSAGKKVVKVSVNFSRRHLGNKDLVLHILSVVDRYQIPHKYIEIELTETTTDVDFQALREIVTQLQSAGINTSVDDFGVGYSSLNLIKELPWNVLKIDKSFLDPVAAGDKAGIIMLSHVIAMAQEMGLECIVEGVETAEQVKFLKQHNCYLAQGYFFDRPLKKAEFESRMEELQTEETQPGDAD